MERFGTVQELLRTRTRGQMMVLFALAFTVLAGAMGMGADMGVWLVERQHLQTAVDSAAIAGARYYVAGAGQADQLTAAQTKAQEYLTTYQYPASMFTGTGESLTFTPLPPRQFRITATKVRNTMLLQLLKVPTLSYTAQATANAEIKADIYVALDTTGSMAVADIAAMKASVATFVTELGLDPTDPNGPQVAIGRFTGQRCLRLNSGGYTWGRGDATNTANMDAFGNYMATTSGWCDNNDLMPNLAASVVPNAATGVPPLDGNSTPAAWNPHFPGAVTVQTLTQTLASATNAANNVDSGQDNPNCAAPSWTTFPSMNPYGNCDILSGTSHLAGLSTGWRELTSVRARGGSFRKVLILETDGTTCTMNTPYTQLAPAASQVGTYVTGAVLATHGNSSSIRAENKSLDLAHYMRTTPTAFSGVEIFTLLFWSNDGTNTCFDNTVYDTDTSGAYPNPLCGPATTVMPASGNRTHVDDYMIGLSSSTPGTCDHYEHTDKNNPQSLTDAFRRILQRLAVGKIAS